MKFIFLISEFSAKMLRIWRNYGWPFDHNFGALNLLWKKTLQSRSFVDLDLKTDAEIIIILHKKYDVLKQCYILLQVSPLSSFCVWRQIWDHDNIPKRWVFYF